jgi:hypothetical protein
MQSLSRESLSPLTDLQLIELEKLLLKLAKNHPALNNAVDGRERFESAAPPAFAR